MPHYFDDNTKTALRPTEFTFSIHQREFHVSAGSGVFSKDELDKGTHTLLTYAQLPLTGKVLDLGCGWGAVGLVIATTHPQLELSLSDVNPRALQFARKNLSQHKAQFILSDAFDNIKDCFDTILLNPPMAAGRDTCYKLIEQSKDRLNAQGTLQLVARHQKGGKALQGHMQQVFGNVEVLGMKGGFRVYLSKKY